MWNFNCQHCQSFFWILPEEWINPGENGLNYYVHVFCGKCKAKCRWDIVEHFSRCSHESFEPCYSAHVDPELEDRLKTCRGCRLNVLALGSELI